jgi:hypothetical protein
MTLRKRLSKIKKNTAVKRWYVNVIKPYSGFCPVLPWQAHRGEFANFIVRPRIYKTFACCILCLPNPPWFCYFNDISSGTWLTYIFPFLSHQVPSFRFKHFLMYSVLKFVIILGVENERWIFFKSLVHVHQTLWCHDQECYEYNVVFSL